jgi:hypothetical protein
VPRSFEPRLDTLPPAQQEIWPSLRPTPRLSYVLYGGTAVALHLGHRQSVDFDFFRYEPLDKDEIRRTLAFAERATVIQDSPTALAFLAPTVSGLVKLSFFGGLRIGRMTEPLQTADGTLLVASLEDLLATKLKATLDRAEAKDYRDIAAMLRAGVSLPHGVAAFSKMFPGGEPAEVLRALGYFGDGDLPSLPAADKKLLRGARDQVRDLPEVQIAPGSLAPPVG